MLRTVLYDGSGHKNIFLEDADSELAVQSNQHLIVHGASGLLLDPGGHKVYNEVLSATFAVLGEGNLDSIFLSHQDPDVVAALNGWLMTTDAEAYISGLWTRFVPHFGLDHLVAHRLHSIPDEGMRLPLGDSEVWILPAHFLHSAGNCQLYDPVSKILYSGDLGASIGMDTRSVTDFDDHLQYMEPFHRRYMTSAAAMTAWAKMARKLDVETIAPQHGAMFSGTEMVGRFIEWADGFECGLDLIGEFEIPD